MNPFGDAYATERVKLSPLKVGMTLQASAKYETVPSNLVADELMYRLTAYVLSEKLALETYTATKVYSRPASTWQMFKQAHENSWWLRWLIQRRPIKMLREPHVVTVDLERNFTYPESNLVPQLGRPVIYERLIPRENS